MIRPEVTPALGVAGVQLASMNKHQDIRWLILYLLVIAHIQLQRLSDGWYEPAPECQLAQL